MSPVASTSHCMSHCTCSIVCLFFSKEKKKKEEKMTRLLRHQSHHRESDGAIGWIPLLLECCRDYLDAPKWTTQKWIDYLQEGCNKNRFQYCLNSDGFILYMRAIQGHSGGNRVDPSLQNSGNSIHWVQYVCQRWFFSRLPFCYPNQVSLQKVKVRKSVFTALDLMNEPQEEHYGVTQPREVLYRTMGRSFLDQFQKVLKTKHQHFGKPDPTLSPFTTPVPADCFERVANAKTEEIVSEDSFIPASAT